MIVELDCLSSGIVCGCYGHNAYSHIYMVVVSQKDVTEPNYGDSKSKSSNGKTFRDRMTHREVTESKFGS